jgi:predicted small lipoprotein YifL
MRKLTLIAIAAFAMTFAACGNKGTNTNSDANKKTNEAPAKVTYETFTVEKYGASFELPKGMRRTDDPKMDNGGNPITYLLGRIEDDSDTPDILEFDDAEGREQTLTDYNVQPGARLHLISRAIAG